MPFINSHLLSLILFVPALAAVLLIFIPGRSPSVIRWTAFLASLIPFVMAVCTWLRFDAGRARLPISGTVHLV